MKLDKFFREFNNPKQTAIVGLVFALLSLVIAPYAMYSIAFLLGIYGSYHGYRKKNWALFFANIAVIIIAITIKVMFHAA